MELKKLETRGIPCTKNRLHIDGFDNPLLEVPSDLDMALAEMERKETITLEQFKKEFKAWNQLTIRMPRCNMVFTKHFVKQLHEVLSFYDETEGHNAPGSALFDVLRWDLRKIIKSPIRESYPTTNPKVRYIMPFDINVTFHYDLEALTVLSICTDS